MKAKHIIIAIVLSALVSVLIVLINKFLGTDVMQGIIMVILAIVIMILAVALDKLDKKVEALKKEVEELTNKDK